jgi:hypothetical protein
MMNNTTPTLVKDIMWTQVDIVDSIACGPYQIHHDYYKDCTHNDHGRFKLEYSVRYVNVMVFVFLSTLY